MDVHMSLKGSAFATRQNYLRGIKILVEYYQRLPEECTVDELKSYLVYQREQPLLPRFVIDAMNLSCEDGFMLSGMSVSHLSYKLRRSLALGDRELMKS